MISAMQSTWPPMAEKKHLATYRDPSPSPPTAPRVVRWVNHEGVEVSVLLTPCDCYYVAVGGCPAGDCVRYRPTARKSLVQRLIAWIAG